MATIITIANALDERIEAYRDVKDRDLIGRQGHFMAEGRLVLLRLFASAFCQTISVLTTQKRLEKLDVSGLPDDVFIYIVSQETMDEVAGFAIHRGYLAIGRYAHNLSLSQTLAGKDRARVMVLSAIANTDNMGGLMRNAAAFGVDCVILDQNCCDPLYRKAIRVSVGAVLQLAHFRLGLNEDLIATLKALSLTAYALSPNALLSLDEVKPDARSAFIFGSEGEGLAEDIMRNSTGVSIPMNGNFDSLNVATSSGIVLYHMSKAS